MTNFSEQLIASTKSWSSAYLQFITGRGREGYSSYVFVEDDDDQIFYQHVLTDRPNLGFIGCGGKGGVLAVYERLSKDNLDGGHCFFVDRDLEAEPRVYDPDVCRTKHYSWESHLSERNLICWILQRRCSPNFGPQDIEEIGMRWENSIANVVPFLSIHTALTDYACNNSISLDMRRIDILQWTEFTETLEAGLTSTNFSWVQDKARILDEIGADVDAILGRAETYTAEVILSFARGKLLFSLLRGFISNLLIRARRRFLGDYNSPKFLIGCMPWNATEFDYIRDYAAVRCASTVGPL